MRSLAAAALIIALPLTLTACGDDEPGDDGAAKQTSSAAPSTSPASPVDDELQAFFTALGGSTEAELQKALKLTAADSPAREFTLFRLAVARAAVDARQPFPASDLTVTKKGYRSCSGYESCVVWGDVQREGGKVVSFTTDGKSSEGRVLGAGQKVDVGSLGTVQLKAAFQSGEDNGLYVVAEFTSKDQALQLEQGVYGSTYRTPKGREIGALEDSGISGRRLAPGSTSSALMFYAEAEIGGSVTFDLKAVDASASGSAVLPIT